jgi:hypothetical protein
MKSGEMAISARMPPFTNFYLKLQTGNGQTVKIRKKTQTILCKTWLKNYSSRALILRVGGIWGNKVNFSFGLVK